MTTIPQDDILASLPASELERSLSAFLEPVTRLLPEVRLRAVVKEMVHGMAASQSPVVTQIARGVPHTEATIWPTSKRGYRFLTNERFSQRTLLKGLYGIAQRAVAAQVPDYLVVAVDPVNFEKPYTRHLEGVSTVMKSTPPSLNGDKRLTRGYPAITATIVNLPQPATSYAHWFSYVTADFVSENWEIYRALRTTRALFRDIKVRFVGDSGLDDQKIFAQVDRLQGEFVFRACHDRRVEVYNDRLNRWESELLFDLTASVPFEFTQKVRFTHARKTRLATVRFGWLKVRLPETQQVLWVLVAHDVERNHDLVLLTNVPLQSAAEVRTVYGDWRLRSRIEHGYRFDQEEGLDVEDMRVHTLERMRRLFILVLLAAQFVFYIGRTWPPTAVLWLRQLGGKLGRRDDLDGPYVLLRGISAVWHAAATYTFLAHHLFPSACFTYG
jgi:hypothetical protein